LWWADRRDGERCIVTGLAGIGLGLAIGFACRWWDLPLPAPPKLTGAMLVVFMTLGFLSTDFALAGL
jgi:XapX domain-containing protein